MTRSSPGVKRIAAILDFMADHPSQAFALTDLVRALKLSRATCHALLTGLVEVGYLYRTTDKTYVLGPALGRLGQAASESMTPLEVAQPEMRALADAYDVVCSIFVREGEATVVRARAASVSHVGYSVPLGSRIPMSTRSAAIFLAWSPEEIEGWLAAAAPQPGEEERAIMMKGVEFARRHGFHAMLHTGGGPGSVPPGGLIANDERREFPVALATEIAPEKAYSLASITAPVFSDEGRVEFVMGMLGFNRDMRGTEIFAAAERLRGACERIGGFIRKRGLR